MASWHDSNAEKLEYEAVWLLLKKTTRAEAQSNTTAMEEGNLKKAKYEYEQLVSLEFPAAPMKGLKTPEKSNSAVYTNCLDTKVHVFI